MTGERDSLLEARSDDERLAMIGRWVLDTCLLFGTTFETAAAVSGHFVDGLARAWRMK